MWRGTRPSVGTRVVQMRGGDPRGRPSLPPVRIVARVSKFKRHMMHEVPPQGLARVDFLPGPGSRACHSERSEESARGPPEILRCAQNDSLDGS